MINSWNCVRLRSGNGRRRTFERRVTLLVVVASLLLPACDREQQENPGLPAPGAEKQAQPPADRPPFLDVPGEHPKPVVRSYPTGERPTDPHLAKGYDVYRNACSACHESGRTTNAPPITDVNAWKPRIAKGKDVLYSNSINGYIGELGFMPPKGGSPGSWSDEEVRAAVDYMVHVVERVDAQHP